MKKNKQNILLKRLSMLLMSITIVSTFTACGSSSDYSGSVSSESYGSSVIGYDGYGSDNVEAQLDAIGDIEPDLNSAGFSSSSKDYSEDYSEDYYEYEEVDTSKPEVSDAVNSSKVYEAKLIYYSDVEIETMEFDKDYANLKSLIEKYNGFIEQENFSNSGSSYLNHSYYSSDRAIVKRQAEILIRIPTEYYDEFNSENEASGNLISKTSNVENITQTYYDTTAQVEALEVQLARLQQMMNEATEYEDLITINQALTQVEYDLNKMKTEVRTMDMDVAYSYVAVNLKEVVEYSEIDEVHKDTFINRLKDTVKNSVEEFGGFLEDLLFAIIMLIPYLVILAVIIIIVKVLFGKKIKDKKQEKKQMIQLLFDKTPEVKENKVEDEKDESTN